MLIVGENEEQLKTVVQNFPHGLTLPMKDIRLKWDAKKLPPPRVRVNGDVLCMFLCEVV